MPKSLKEALTSLAGAAKAGKVPVKVTVSIPLTDAKGAERHAVTATPDAFSKADGTGTGLIKSVLGKSTVVKVSVSVVNENGDKATSSPDPLPAPVWVESYAKA